MTLDRDKMLDKLSTLCARPIESFSDLTPMEVEALLREAWKDDSVMADPKDQPEHPDHFARFIDIPNATDSEGNAILRANPGKIRVVGVDTFSHEREDWVYEEYDTLDEAKVCANFHGEPMLKVHVYDDTGRHLHEAGTF